MSIEKPRPNKKKTFDIRNTADNEDEYNFVKEVYNEYCIHMSHFHYRIYKYFSYVEDLEQSRGPYSIFYSPYISKEDIED